MMKSSCNFCKKNNMLKFKRVFLSFLFFLALFYCSPSQGEFGWAATNNEGMDAFEKQFYIVTEYKMMRSNIFFSPTDKIHYVYKFGNFPVAGSEFIVVLEKESLGFVEIDLKKKLVESESNSLRDSFDPLSVGKYRLKIVYDQETLDEAIFEVLPEGGYYNLEVQDSDSQYEEQDEILKYSR